MAIANTLVPARDTRALLIKWIVGLLVPIAVFTFVWSGEAIINNALLGVFGLGGVSDIAILIQVVSISGHLLCNGDYACRLSRRRR